MEENAWVKTCSNVFVLKWDSTGQGMIILEKVYTKTLETWFGLSKNAQMLFEKIGEKDFDIFEFKWETKDNELVTLSSLIL